MQEVEQRDRNGRPRLSQTNFRVPSSRSSYGNTPGWVEKATKDFLDSAGDTEIGIGIKKLPYTKPKLRESIKNRIMAGSKGGRPGQWSARKAQLLAQEYRRAGGGYRGKPGRAQRSLKKWTKERWTTADGKPANRKGKMTRYLPAAAWKRLTPAQRRATIAKKLSGDKQGRQFVPNTERAASVSRRIRSKTLGPSVEEVAKNPNAPQMFGDNFPNMEKEPREDKPKDKYSPDKSKLRELDAAVYYGDDEPIKPFLRGNIEIDDRKPVEKQTGSFVVIDPIVVDGAGDDAGMFIIVPRVTKFGQLIDDETAKSQFEKTGDHLGKFKTSNEAQIYLDWLTDIEDDIAYRDKKKPITSVVSMEKIGESTSDGFESRRLAIRSTIKKLADKYLTEKSIGPRLGALNSVQIYDPDAIDADNDGFVQDATPWMRPALPSSPIIAGLRSVKKSNTATQRAIRESQEFLNLVSQYEPDLTEMMKSLAAKKNSSLYLRGLRNRQKPVESLALKAQRLQHLFDNNLSDAITSMNDPLRYTFESDDLNKYTKDVLGVISALAKKGHVATLTNYWTSGDPYKGVNAMVQHPAGFFYEIQFHTPSSYRLKNKLTPLYQKYRDEKNVQKRQEIYDEMLKLSKGVSIPKDIGKFGEPLSRGSGRADFKPVRPGKLVPTPNRKNGKRITQGVESSRRRMMTEEEKARFQPLEIADDKKAKLQPGTTLVFANEYDEILRTELIGPQVARVRSVPGVKLYIDPNPDNQDEIDRTMRKWDEMFGPVSSSQRQARGRSKPNRDERSRNQPRQGSRNQPRQEDEDPLDRINRLVDEDRKRRGLESRRDNGMSSRTINLEEISDEEIRIIAEQKGLPERDLDRLYRAILSVRNFLRKNKGEQFSYAPGLGEETAKRMRDSIRVEVAPNGVPMVIAEPFEDIVSEIPDKRDWSKVLAPSMTDIGRLVDAIREARNSGSPIPETLSEESREKVRKVTYSDNEDSPFNKIMKQIVEKLGSAQYPDTFSEGDDLWVSLYLRGLAIPERMAAGMGTDGVHDFFGHFGIGRGFDRHGEWAAALATDSLIRDHPAFDFLTPDEREYLRREFFVYGAGGAQRIPQQLDTEYEQRFGISRHFSTTEYDSVSQSFISVEDTRTPEQLDAARAFDELGKLIGEELVSGANEAVSQRPYFSMDQILDLLGVPPTTTRMEARGMKSTRSSRNSIPFTKASDGLLLSIAGNEAAIKQGRSMRDNNGMSSSQGTKWNGESLSREQVLAEMEGDADLSGANLSYLNLNDVDLDYANLSGANLYSADLTYASLAGVNLTEATLDGADLSSAHLLGADLSYASLNSTNLSFAELSDTDFSSANLYEADLRGAILLNSTMHDIDLDFANLMGADLYEADLSGANLENTNLRETNFLNADLSEARLSGADLFNANITGANITDADFTGADIRGIIADKRHVELRKIQKQQQQFGVQRPKGEGFVVRFENTAWNGRRPLDSEILTEAKRLGRLRGAYLAGVNLSGREMGMIDLSLTNLEMANLQDAELARAIFEGSNLKNANLSRANLKGAKFDGANLEEAILDMADLTDASLTGANLRNSYTYGAIFRRANLSGANLEDQSLRDKDFRGADLRKTNLRNADLSGANLEEADLRGADLTGAILDGANLTDANTQGAIGMSSQRSPEHSMAKSYFESVGDSQAMSDLSFNLLMDREQIRAAAFSYALPRVETLMNQGKTGEEIADELDLPLLGVAIIVQGIPQDGSNNIYGGEKLKSGRSKFKVLDGLFRAPRALLAEKPYADKPELLGIDIAESLGVDKTKAMSLLAQLTATHYAFTVSEFADIFDVDLATAVSSKYRANLSIEDAVDVALELNMSLKDFFDSPMSDAIPAVRVIKSLPGSEDILLDALREEVDKNIELGDNDTARELMSAIEHLSEKFNSNRAAEALVGTSQMDDDEWMNFAVLGEVSREIMSGGESGEAMLEDIIDRLSTDETIQDIADSYRTTTEDIATSVIGFGKLPDDETKAGMYVYRVLIPENPGLPESNTATHVQPMPNSKIVAKLLNTSEEHIAYLVREYAKDNDLPVEYLIEAFSYHGLNAPFVAKVLGVTMSEVFDLLIDEDIAYSERRLRKGFKRTGFDNLTRPMRLGRELEKLIDEDGYSIQDIAIMMDMDVSEVDKLIKDWQRALRNIRKGI